MAVCTLVVPVHNQLEYTRRCLESVFRHTDVPYDLVVVDNGSRDGTAAFLAGLRQRPVPRRRRYEVLTNPVNAGVAPAWNQGLRAARPGVPVAFLNNDIVVTPGWLRAVLGFLTEHLEAGIAGPHVVDGPEARPDLDAWAARYAAEHRERVDDGFHGCCFVLTPRLIERVGAFDERFEVGIWEDVDYCHRARLAGFSPRVTHRAVIHHFGNRTISEVTAEQAGRNLYRENMDRFAEKWGIRLGEYRVSRSILFTG